MGYYGGSPTALGGGTIAAVGSDSETVFQIKQGDTLPVIQRQLLDLAGDPLQLEGCTVRFLMGIPGGDVIVAAAATIVDAIAGTVEYRWVAGDTATVGTFREEWEVTYPDGTVQTVPTVRSNLKIKVSREIG